MGISSEVRGQLALRFKVLFPHLNERQRRLLIGQEARLLPSTTSGPSCTESDTPQRPPHDASPTHTHYSPPSCRPRHRTRPPHQVDVLRVQPTRQRERAMKGFRSVGRSPTDPGRVQRDLTALPTPTPPSHRRRTPPRNDHPLRHLGTHHRCPHPARSSLTRHHQTRQPHPDMPSATPAADNVTAPSSGLGRPWQLPKHRQPPGLVPAEVVGPLAPRTAGLRRCCRLGEASPVVGEDLREDLRIMPIRPTLADLPPALHHPGAA